MNDKTDQLLGDIGDVVAGLTRTVDEVMPLAQCLGALCDYLKKDPSLALSFNQTYQQFVLVQVGWKGVYSADFFDDGSSGRILLEALNTWFAKENQKS